MEPKVAALKAAGNAEADILHSVRAIIRELDQDKPAFQRSQGMFRWTLHKKIERDPYNSAILARILIDELEQARRENKPYIIPLLNTLLYTIIQAVYIPDDLYEKAYKFCKELLSWARPYCIIGYEYAVMLQAERKAPGALHQRLVVAEHCLKNESFPHGEKVFIFADPDLVSKEVCEALRTEVHSATASQPSAVYKMHVIQHCVQAALGESCDLKLLQEALQSKPHWVIERHFQEVLSAMDYSCSSKKELPAISSKHRTRMHQLYTNILDSTHQVDPLKGRLQNIPLPNPDIRLVIWREDDDLWQELEEFVTNRLCYEAPSTNRNMYNAEMNEEVTWSNHEQTRFSVLSTDSGIVRDCGDVCAAQDAEPSQDATSAHSPGAEACERERPKLSRRHGVKIKHAGSDKLTPLLDFIDGASSLQRRSGRDTLLFNLNTQRGYTARVVMIGNDCILGRLAKAFHSLRKREVRRLFLTSKLDVQFYYVPVPNTKWASAPLSKICPSHNSDHSCELSRYLGIIDPWYHSNINSLQTMVPELATMSASCRQPTRSDPFIVDVITYYVRMGHQPVCFQIYTVKLLFAQEITVCVEDVFLIQLQLDLPDLKDYQENTTPKKRASAESCGMQLSVSYTKVTPSRRTRTKQFTCRCNGAILKTIPTSGSNDLVCLDVTISEMISKSSLSGKTYSIENTKFQSSEIKIEIPDNLKKTMMVCLDKDCRRIYKDVVSIEVTPTLEPRSCLQKLRTLRLSPNESVGLTKYLQLPINTFSGALH